ncbi:MAG: hypothetical protein IJG08_03585 [Oscillospiraceae bacterium]|nr:hypothetical protein [Oscillospiraceae bacterium]
MRTRLKAEVNKMVLDVELLRSALVDECYASCVVRGNVNMLADTDEIMNASVRRLLELAKHYRLDPRKYQKPDADDES